MKTITKKWKIEKANSEELALKYINAYAALGNADLKLPYVMNCNSIMVYKDGILLGGVIFNAGQFTFRYFSVFHNDDEKIAVLENEDLNEADLMEITSIWHKKGLSISDRFIFFLIIYWRARVFAKMNQKTFLIGGSLIKQVQKYQFRAMPRILISMPIDSSTVEHHGSTSSVAKIYGVKTRFFMRNVVILLISDVFSAIFKSIFKKISRPKSSGRLVVQR